MIDECCKPHPPKEHAEATQPPASHSRQAYILTRSLSPGEEAALIQELESFRHTLRPMIRLSDAQTMEDSPLLCEP